MNVPRIAETPTRASGSGLDCVLTRLAANIGVGVAAAGFLVLCGWTFDVQALKSLSPNLVTMKPNTAAGFVLGGISLRLLAQRTQAQVWQWRAWLARGSALLVGMLGLLTLGQYGWGWDLGIDQALFAESSSAVGTSAPGRMSPFTAFNFLMLAAALLLIDVETRAGRRPSNWFALIIAADSYVALLGYFYDAQAMYGMAGTTAVALLTTILFLALSMGLLCARPDAHFFRQITGASVEGVLSRRLLPAAIAIPPLLGWLRLLGEQSGYYSGTYGLALITASTAAILVALIWGHARHLQLEASVREQVEQALRDSERRFRATFEHAAIGFAMVSLQGRFVAINQTLCTIVGYPREELQNLTFQEITHPEDLVVDLDLLDQLLAGEIHSYTLEKRYIRKDRSLVWINLTASLVRTAAGSPDYFIASVEDISERKTAEAELKSARDMLHQRVAERTAQLQESNTQLVAKAALIEAIHRGQTQFIAGASSQSVFDSLLASFLQLSGSAYGFVDELRRAPDGQPFLTSLAITDISWSPQTRTMHAQFLAGLLNLTRIDSLYGAVMTTGKPVIANDAANDSRRGVLPPGHPKLNAFLGLPLYCSGRFVGVIGLANRPGGYSEQDIAFLEPLTQASASLLFAWRSERDRQAVEEALSRQAAQLAAANKELESFSYSVAHDLRAPLRSIDGFAQVLIEDFAEKLGDSGRDSLRRVRDAAQRMGHLIDDLLALSRVSSGELEVGVVDLSAAAWFAVAALRKAMPEREVDVSITPGIRANGDPRLLAIALGNLFGNAWKFTAKQPAAVIEFDAELHAGELRCHVRDNGAGFDMAEASKLFGPFQRLHKASEFPGTGIGLATTKRIIARHGGRVWAEGAVGQGATFFFSLPHPVAGPEVRHDGQEVVVG